ncbi:hypothetical protein ACQ4LE_006682 [Meloidogyne hapla]|uniref:Carn_acyltransf domain-containing protein n=1 Tax=Meloidogyne hapla TaxID=6305 RepID=A0A1I8B3G2_MELHA
MSFDPKFLESMGGCSYRDMKLQDSLSNQEKQQPSLSHFTPTIADHLKQTELLVGRAYAEHMALLFSSSSQISRDPDGNVGSKIHMDLFTGMDERIGFPFLTRED